MKLYFTLSILAINALCAVQLLAQPTDFLQMKGCRYAAHPLAAAPLSEQERLLVCGSNARSDSIDVLNYDILLDLTDFASKTIAAVCGIRFTALQPSISTLPLDLLALTVDSVKMDTLPLDYNYNDLLLEVHLPAPLTPADTATVQVWYRGKPTADPSGFGGFVFDQNIAYNLGIGLSSNPYNFGRSWHPCFDNFVERATYDITIRSNGGRRGYAIGEFLSEQPLDGNTIERRYRMEKPLPTYLVGSATSNYIEHHDVHDGAYNQYPVLLLGKPADSAAMVEAFTYLGDAVDALEAWYGPYAWEQVGYVLTPRGAMEHASLIAFPDFSIGNGPSASMNRLMAHELAHHWWGNITTLSCPENMWIKEGNAEYGAHLFTEFAFGKEAFVQQVKSNHYNVLQNAHKDDGGNFLPLSGIPYEYTYGTHTYNKGASVMHNLRGYLGDSLFRQGMRSILDTYGFESVDAQQFRDQLTSNTGVDLTSFFDDWIYSPGFAAYEIDSVVVAPTPIPEEYQATVYVEQKLRAAPHLHTNVPIEITFFDRDWNAWHTTIEVSGAYSAAAVKVPFNPVWQVLNDRNKLNLARMQHRTTITQPGDVGFSYTDVVTFSAKAVPDSTLLNVIHYWVAPDPIVPNPSNAQLSSSHYWRFDGIVPDGFKASATLQYRGANVFDFDYDLTHGNEDSLILLWRPNTSVAWKHYPWYKKLTLGGSTDGNGFIRIDTLLPGDYAFANGNVELATGISEPQVELDLKVFPNPSKGGVRIEAALPFPTGGPLTLSVVHATGALQQRQTFPMQSGSHFAAQLELPGVPPGLYLLRLSDAGGRVLAAGRVILLE